MRTSRAARLPTARAAPNLPGRNCPYRSTHERIPPCCVTSACAALVALFIAGCSRADRPLIAFGFGTQKVTAEDYLRAARGAQQQYPGPPDVAKSELVQDLTRRAMMLEMAHQLGHDQAPVVVNTDRDNERRTLVQMLFARIASASQPRVRGRGACALRGAQAGMPGVDDLHLVARVGDRRAGRGSNTGEPFVQVSQSMSLPGVLPPDGDMGVILPGALPDPLDGAVRHQKVGVVGGPFETREGWFLVKVTSRQPHEQVSWDMMRAGMFDLERQRKQRAAFNRAYQDLKAEWQMQLAPGWLAAAVPRHLAGRAVAAHARAAPHAARHLCGRRVHAAERARRHAGREHAAPAVATPARDRDLDRDADHDAHRRARGAPPAPERRARVGRRAAPEARGPAVGRRLPARGLGRAAARAGTREDGVGAAEGPLHASRQPFRWRASWCRIPRR